MGFFIADALVNAYLGCPDNIERSDLAQRVIGRLTADHRMKEISFTEKTKSTDVKIEIDNGNNPFVRHVVAPPMKFKKIQVTRKYGIEFSAKREVSVLGEQLAYLISSCKNAGIDNKETKIIVSNFIDYLK